MIPEIKDVFFGSFFNALALGVALLFGTFFYWRAAKRELVENQVIFDTVMLFVSGSFVGGRIIDFVVRADFYMWSVKKFLFFNAFWGFDVLGAFLGGVLVVWFYLRVKKENFWDIMDYAAEGFALGALLFYLLDLVKLWILDKSYFISCFVMLGFIFLFWVHKRLAKQKKHKGFFACMFLIFLVLIIIGSKVFNFAGDIKDLLWPALFSSAVAVFAMINWYRLAKRRPLSDLKSFTGLFLLFLFKTFRTLTSVREADGVARFIVLSPLYIAKGLVNFVKYVSREIYLSFVDVAHAFGIKK